MYLAPCGYNVTGQLQEPKDLTRPATVKVAYAKTVFVRGFATHLTLTYGYPHIWLSEPEGRIGPTEPLPKCQRHSPQGLVIHDWISNPQPFDYRPS